MHTVRASILLQPIIGFWCSVWCWKLPHAVVPCHVVSIDIAVAMVVSIENPAGCEVWGSIRFLQADEILGYLAEEASSCVELFCCTTMHVRILPGRHKLAEWAIPLGHLQASSVQSGPGTVGLFPKMKEHLAGKCFANDEDLKDAGWITRRPHGMKRVYTNWCQGTTRLS